MFLQQVVEFVQCLVDGFLSYCVLLFGNGGLEGGGWLKGLREREDLSAQESGFEVDYCGVFISHSEASMCIGDEGEVGTRD